MGVAKVILNGNTLIDTTQKTVAANKMLSGATALDKAGESITGSIATKTSSDLTASGATVTAPAGYYASSASKSVSSGSATAPATITGTSATVSTGTNTLTLTKSVSVTPSVTAGYVSSGTAGNSSVSLTASVTTKGATTYTPTTSDQTISSGTYLTGAQTISGDANLVAGNIKDGTTIFGVTGTYSGGSSMNVQTNHSVTRISTSYLKVASSLSCTTAGTYDVYYTCSRTDTSGTWSSALYINGTIYGSENTTWSQNVQNNTVTDVAIGANVGVAVYVKTPGSGYYAYAPQLTIVQTA